MKLRDPNREFVGDYVDMLFACGHHMEITVEQYRAHCNDDIFNNDASVCPVCRASGKPFDVIRAEYASERDKFIEEHSWDLFRSDFLPRYLLNAEDYL